MIMDTDEAQQPLAHPRRSVSGTPGVWVPFVLFQRNENWMSHHNHRTKAHESHPATADARPCASAPAVPDCQPTPERIRRRAYEISQARNGGPGNPQADWNQAERELVSGGLAGVTRTVDE